MTNPGTTHTALRRPALVATAAALGVNLGLLAVGSATGASFAVPDRARPGELMQIGPVPVALSTVLPLVVGFAAAALVARRWPGARRVLAVVAVVVTLASLATPLTADTDAGTRLLLAAMHLVVGAAYLAGLRESAARSASTSEPESATAASAP